MPNNKKWSPSAKYCASMLHIVASIAVMEQVQVQEWKMLWASLVVVVVVAVKEFWADLTWLEHDSLGGSTLDFICYIWGVGLFWFSVWKLWVAIVLFLVTIFYAVGIDMADQGVILAEDEPYD